MSDNHDKEIGVLEKQLNRFLAEDRYSEALDVALRLYDLLYKYKSSDHERVVMGLVNVARILNKQGQFAKAEGLFIRALEFARQSLEEGHRVTGTIMNDLASVYFWLGKLDDAESLFLQALQIRRADPGENGGDYATTLNNLGTLYTSKGNLVEAEKYLIQALEMRERESGTNLAGYRTILNNLAALYKFRGELDNAESYYLKASSTIPEETRGGSAEYALYTDNLGAVYADKGFIDKAELLFVEALKIRQKILPEDHPDIALSLNNLAGIHQTKGQFAKAEDYYLRALKIRAKLPSQREAAETLTALGLLSYAKNDFAASEGILNDALEIQSATIGTKHPEYARTLNHLAIVQFATRKFTEAENNWLVVKDILMETLGERNPEYIVSLTNLGLLYFQKGELSQAETYNLRALRLINETLGTDHEVYAKTLSNLAMVNYFRGELSQAETYNLQALKIIRDALGEKHPDIARILTNLSGIYAITSRLDEAIRAMMQASQIDEEMLGEIFSSSSERERMAYLTTLNQGVDIFLSILMQKSDRSEADIADAYGFLLRRKGLSAEALMIQRNVSLSGRYPELASRIAELSVLRSRISRISLGGRNILDPKKRQEHLTKLLQKKEELEAELSQKVPEIRLESVFRKSSTESVIKALPADQILIEFVKFNMLDFHPPRGNNQRGSFEPHYLAFVISSSKPNKIVVQDLGPSQHIDDLILSYRSSIVGYTEVRNLEYVETNRAEHKRGRPRSGFELKTKLFDPLLAALGQRKRLYIAPDGDISRLPFETLPIDRNNHYLIDNFLISYLSTGKDILRLETASMEVQRSLVVSDPDFDIAADSRDRKDQEIDQDGLYERKLADDQSRDWSGSKVYFKRLHGTEQEGKSVAEILNAVHLAKDKVLEASLKTYRSPNILHIATHGFFLPNQTAKSDRVTELSIPQQSLGNTPFVNTLGAELENPMLRSGLALAGANTWIRGGLLPEQAEDGILNAEDVVANMDLSGTNLVVLSACETGLGEVLTGEGVFGLRRAFVLAGAKTLVMSLWKVPDEQTRELMIEFYINIRLGKSRSKALRDAQIKLKAKYDNPFFWGSFILQGESAPFSI